MNAIFRYIFFAIFFSFAAHVYAEDHATADEAVSMVHKVIADINANGRDKVIAEINDLSVKYRDKDLYVTITDMTGLELAHGTNKKMQNKNILDLRDSDNKFFMRERLQTAKSQGKGWQDYNFVNPVSKEVEPKHVYFEKFEDIVVSAGVYKGK